MKDAQSILSSILQAPYLKPLKMRLQLDKLKLFLPPAVSMGLVSIVMKNSKLLLAFKHPSTRYYFQANYQEFSQILLQAIKKLEIEVPSDLQIQTYIPCRIAQNFESKAPKATYTERSKGHFINHATDPEIHTVFELIRTCVKHNNGR
ncbi:hypothetical protein HSUHS5_1210 [Helicobacter suis HS5]|uniref:DUF721 domain-containing protein n=1 Tax=Helicobacter suis HS5 TaxID=710394 RepID=E7G5C4_9HELI|nr:hypothetical protein [Helicobacter suis]EFX41428.1 hypothetical protein HSUHS5_1210 [Helicobacter suis HS5]